MGGADADPALGASLADGLANLTRLVFPHRDWGGWTLTDTWLEYADPCYGFDLCRFTSSAKMLDMILQVAAKTWVSDVILVGLVHALQDILHPQGGLCCGGIDHPRTPEAIKHMCQSWHEAQRQQVGGDQH